MFLLKSGLWFSFWTLDVPEPRVRKRPFYLLKWNRLAISEKASTKMMGIFFRFDGSSGPMCGALDILALPKARIRTKAWKRWWSWARQQVQVTARSQLQAPKEGWLGAGNLRNAVRLSLVGGMGQPLLILIASLHFLHGICADSALTGLINYFWKKSKKIIVNLSLLPSRGRLFHIGYVEHRLSMSPFLPFFQDALAFLKTMLGIN